MNNNEIISDIYNLKSQNAMRFYKYQRNARIYTWSPLLSLNELNSSQCVGYYNLGTYEGESNTSSIQENVIASCVDTLVSKIASTKVRPFFNCVNGSFKDIKLAKQAQNFFDIKFDEENVNKTISLAFKDACVFDTGVVYIDEDYKIKRANPWQVYTDPAEVSYNRITKVAMELRCFPTSLLDNKSKHKYVTLYKYYNVKEHILATYIQELNKVTIKKLPCDNVPFIFLHYISPIAGNTSTSVADLLYGIQMKIDEILKKVSDAVELNPALTFFVPDGSQIKAKQLDNRVGNVITYKPSPNMTSSPVTTATPAFIDPSYMATLQQLKQDAYEMIGISQLSATSQKPRGLDSGAALQTMEDIESDRFETQLNQIVRAYVDLTKIFMDIVPEDYNILPEDNVREELKWSDIKKASKQMNIQYSGANALSKDPETKLRQLTMLQQSGIVPRSRIATLMEVPDLEAGYSISNNALNATLAVIDDCINKDRYDVPFFIPIDMLKEEIANTMLSLQAADSEGNQPDIDKLKRLYEIVVQSSDLVNKTMQMEQMNEEQVALTENQQNINDNQMAEINGQMANI